MKYKVQGSFDGGEWYDNQRVERSCGKYGYDFENLEVATVAFNEYLETRSWKFRRIIDENSNIIKSYSPTFNAP